MVVVYRGNKIQRLNSDSDPTTGLSLYQLLEIVDTNVWKYWNGSSWIVLGTNSVNPVTAIPGDVSGSNAGQGQYYAPMAGGSTESMAFQITTSKRQQPQAKLPGQHLFEADTGNWFRWTGIEWADDVSPATIGTASEKGGGVASFVATTTQTVFNIAHGVGAIPSIVMVCPATAAATGQIGSSTNTTGYAVTADATNIIITYITGLASNAAVSFNWFCRN